MKYYIRRSFEGQTYFLITSYDKNVLVLDDVWAEDQEFVDRIPDDIIENERKNTQELLNGWDHPRSAAEDRLFEEYLNNNDIFNEIM